MQLFNKFMLIKRGTTQEVNLERAADILKLNNHNLHTYFWNWRSLHDGRGFHWFNNVLPESTKHEAYEVITLLFIFRFFHLQKSYFSQTAREKFQDKKLHRSQIVYVFTGAHWAPGFH